MLQSHANSDFYLFILSNVSLLLSPSRIWSFLIKCGLYQVMNVILNNITHNLFKFNVFGQ